MHVNVDNVTIEVRLGDIVAQHGIDAIVNAANSELKPGGGVAGAIHFAAGKELRRACEPLAPVAPGEAVITPGFNLPNKFVIHCLGPVYGRDEPSDALLAACYARALALAEEAKIHSIAYPAISTGSFGYPLSEAAEVACRTVVGRCQELKHLQLVRFVLPQAEAHKAFSDALTAAIADRVGGSPRDGSL